MDRGKGQVDLTHPSKSTQIRDTASPVFFSKETQEKDLKVAQGSTSKQQEDSDDEEYIWALPLIRAMESYDWNSFKSQFDRYDCAETRTVNSRGENFLHLATETGNGLFVRNLVNRMSGKDLERKDSNGDHALIYAATGGITDIAELLVKKNANLTCIMNQHGLLPVVIAAKNGNKDMAHYLYSATPQSELNPEISKNGARLVIAAVVSDMQDIALDLLKEYPKLAIACDSHGRNAATVLAERPSAFPSGRQHRLWERLVYRGIPLRHGVNYLEEQTISRRDGIKTLRARNLVPGFIRKICEEKLIHVKSADLLKLITTQLSSLSESQLERAQAYIAINNASKFGIVEIVSEFIKCNPNLQFSTDTESRDIFQIAAMHRQEKVFNLIYDMRNKKMITVRGDKSYNNLLHTVGLKTSSLQLDKISGAALQMQRELQWFKEVQRLVPPRFKEEKNKDQKTPREVFTENHLDMVIRGEKWMKETAQGCMVVSTLIATVMFTAAFTVPGGNNSVSGSPVFIRTKYFLLFIVTDALSLFSSCSSLLMFLAIITSRYAEQDFLLSLPRKLILGLTTLFLSVATMLMAFCAALFIVLKDRSASIPILCTLLAGVPVSLFVMLQFPLLADMIYSTYGPSIFGK